MLDMCLDRINQAGESESIGVTLLIGHMAIAGDLIHPTTYYKSVQSELLKNRNELKKVDAEETGRLQVTQKQTTEIFLDNVEIHGARLRDIKKPIAINVDSIDVFILNKLDLSPEFPKFDPADMPRPHYISPPFGR